MTLLRTYSRFGSHSAPSTVTTCGWDGRVGSCQVAAAEMRMSDGGGGVHVIHSIRTSERAWNRTHSSDAGWFEEAALGAAPLLLVPPQCSPSLSLHVPRARHSSSAGAFVCATTLTLCKNHASAHGSMHVRDDGAGQGDPPVSEEVLEAERAMPVVQIAGPCGRGGEDTSPKRCLI